MPTDKYIHTQTYGTKTDLIICPILWYSNGTDNKLPQLRSLLYHETRDIILITETWLSGNIPNGLLDPEGKFHIYGIIVKNGEVVAFVY